MADYSGGGAAADQLEQEPPDRAGPPAAGQDEGGREDTFFLPPDFPGAEKLKPGDPLTLRVVGKDAEGGIEVEHVPDRGPGEPEWKSDLKRNVPNTPGGGGLGNEPEM